MRTRCIDDLRYWPSERLCDGGGELVGVRHQHRQLPALFVGQDAGESRHPGQPQAVADGAVFFVRMRAGDHFGLAVGGRGLTGAADS